MLPLTIKGKEATLAVIRIIAGVEAFCDNPYSPPTPLKSNSLNRKSLKLTLIKCYEGAEV